ncbi:MAG: metalloregulator ArsR/SmtB family transcription factor [Pseudomonadota bacterium]
MELNEAAICLEKLGNPTRLEIFRLLVKAGNQGLSVGEIQEHLGVPASTLSHHVSQLLHAGLLRQDREGRVLRCSPNWDLMNRLIQYLTSECCILAEPDKELKRNEEGEVDSSEYRSVAG